MGHAVLLAPGSNAACEQVVEVISPSGKVCGSSTFAVGDGSCTTSSIIVGYDGTVVQQLPREREAPCTAADHQCDCTYRYWSDISARRRSPGATDATAAAGCNL
jgi:hypothetical protein